MLRVNNWTKSYLHSNISFLRTANIVHLWSYGNLRLISYIITAKWQKCVNLTIFIIRFSQSSDIDIELKLKIPLYLPPGRTCSAWAGRRCGPGWVATGSWATARRNIQQQSLIRTSSCAALAPRRSPFCRFVFFLLNKNKGKTRDRTLREHGRVCYKYRFSVFLRSEDVGLRTVSVYGGDSCQTVASTFGYVDDPTGDRFLKFLVFSRRTPADWAGSMWHSRILYQSAMPTSCLPSHRLL